MNDLSREARALIAEARPAELPDASAKRRVRVALAATLVSPPGDLRPHPDPAAGSAAGGAVVGTGAKLVLLCTLTTAALVGAGAGLHHWAASRQTSVQPSRHPPKPQPPEGQPASVASDTRSLPPTSRPMSPGRGTSGTRHASVSDARSGALRPSRSSPEAPTVARLAADRANQTTEPAAERAVPADEALPLVTGAPHDRSGVSPTVASRSEVAARPVREITVSTEQVAPSRSRASPAQAETGCSAKEELRLLARAQIALRERRGSLALAVLDQHQARCPSARFREEHRTEHILALCLLHRREQALAEAAELAAETPRSPQLARLRTSCAAAAVEPVTPERAGP
jgi:hypothetical protein